MKKKKGLLIVGILIGIFCVVGVSYAIWQVTHVQTGENSLTVGCFKVEFTDFNPIQIGKAYPIEDKVGKTLTPYEFTLTNICNDLASYQINLEVLNDSTMNEHSYIKAMLDEESPYLLTSNQIVEKTLENATTAYKLKKSFLSANETKNFTLRLWLDESTPPNEEIMNSVFKSKVTITTSFIDEAPLASGTLRTIYTSTNDGMWQYKGQITKLIIEDELKPIIGAIGSFDESSKKDGSVMSYIVENPKENETEETTYTAYLQSNEKLYLNNGSCLFFNFKKLESIEGIRYMDTSNITYMGYMFQNCSSLTTLDLSNFNTSKVTGMESMFQNCSSLTSIDLSNFDTRNVTFMISMFNGCSSLTSLDVSNFSTEKVTNMRAMFYYCENLITLDLSHFNTSNVTLMDSIFRGCSSLTTLDLSSFKTSNVTDMSDMFYGCRSLTTLDLNSFNTSNVTVMSYMFQDCSNLTALDISSFKTSNVTSMRGMFLGCRSLTTLDISNFNTEKVTDMVAMFYECNSLALLDLDNFETRNVTNMADMFQGCSNLTLLDLSNFNTEQVTNMSRMFYRCNSLTTLDVSNFNTEKVTNMGAMFYGCKNLTFLDLSGFHTLNVTNSNYVYKGFQSMFDNCSKLTKIEYGSNFIYANDANVTSMFSSCPANKPTHESWSGLAL